MIWVFVAALSLGACTTSSGPKDGATFSGTVSSSQGGAISGATVTVTPSGGAALAGVTTDANGDYTVDAIPAGDGTVAVSNVPSDCSAPTPLQYTGAKNGGARTVNLTVPCSSSSTTLP
jgi:hypothetical protein